MIRAALIEDDIHLLQAIAREISEDGGFELMLSATTAEDALAFTGWNEVDVALVDVMLPGASGLHVAEVLAEKHPGVRVVMCTAVEDRETVMGALRLGASGYLLKRHIAAEPIVCASLRDVVEGNTPLSPAAARWLLQDFRAIAASGGEVLTPRELQILKMREEGQSYKEIAGHLDLSWHTVHAHIRKIGVKLRSCGRNL